MCDAIVTTVTTVLFDAIMSFASYNCFLWQRWLLPSHCCELWLFVFSFVYKVLKSDEFCLSSCNVRTVDIYVFSLHVSSACNSAIFISSSVVYDSMLYVFSCMFFCPMSSGKKMCWSLGSWERSKKASAFGSCSLGLPVQVLPNNAKTGCFPWTYYISP